jgi:hypothetical protein
MNIKRQTPPIIGRDPEARNHLKLKGFPQRKRLPKYYVIHFSIPSALPAPPFPYFYYVIDFTAI